MSGSTAHRPPPGLLLLLLAVVQPLTEASLLLDRVQQSSASALSSTKETPLRAMLFPGVGLLSGNDALRQSTLRQSTAPVTAQYFQAKEKEDHPQPMQQRFDRATTTQPSNRDLAVAHRFEPAKNVWDWVPFSKSWKNLCEKGRRRGRRSSTPEKMRKRQRRFRRR